jgi:hypothetical protein
LKGLPRGCGGPWLCRKGAGLSVLWDSYTEHPRSSRVLEMPGVQSVKSDGIGPLSFPPFFLPSLVLGMAQLMASLTLSMYSTPEPHSPALCLDFEELQGRV